MIIGGLILVFAITRTSIAFAPVVEQKPPQTVQEMIKEWATFYNSPYQELMVVAKCESGYKKDVYGDGGRAYSVFQFHRPTFERWAIEMGEELDYYSYNDNIKLASWAFAKGEKYKKHWTCYTKLVNKPTVL